MTGRGSFFANEVEDRDLAIANGPFWDALIEIIENDRSRSPCSAILDVGCHGGGFLDRVAGRWSPDRVYGIEPIENLRRQAAGLLAKHRAASVVLGSPETWTTIRSGEVDLITCQEVLYLISDLPALFEDFRRVLASGGAAYVTLGSHVENPLWGHWRELLIRQGIQVFDYAPLEIMSVAENCGFWPSVRPLRTDGWITYAPSESRFPVENVGSLLDHHFRHKLLFRFEV